MPIVSANKLGVLDSSSNNKDKNNKRPASFEVSEEEKTRAKKSVRFAIPLDDSENCGDDDGDGDGDESNFEMILSSISHVTYSKKRQPDILNSIAYDNGA